MSAPNIARIQAEMAEKLSSLTYEDKKRVHADICNLLAQTNSLNPKVETYVYNDGRAVTLIVLDGTVPMYYKGTQYNIPVNIWVPERYPAVAPTVYVTPTRDMRIKNNHKHVDREGMVYHSYLHGWNPTCNIINLILVLSQVFSEEPPCYRFDPSRPIPPATATAATAAAATTAAVPTPPQPSQPPQSSPAFPPSSSMAYHHLAPSVHPPPSATPSPIAAGATQPASRTTPSTPTIPTASSGSIPGGASSSFAQAAEAAARAMQQPSASPSPSPSASGAPAAPGVVIAQPISSMSMSMGVPAAVPSPCAVSPAPSSAASSSSSASSSSLNRAQQKEDLVLALSQSLHEMCVERTQTCQAAATQSQAEKERLIREMQSIELQLAQVQESESKLSDALRSAEMQASAVQTWVVAAEGRGASSSDGGSIPLTTSAAAAASSGPETFTSEDLMQMVVAKDTWSQQLLDAKSTDLAIDDTLLSLADAFQHRHRTSPPAPNPQFNLREYLKLVRKTARKQFFARALAIKIGKKIAERETVGRMMVGGGGIGLIPSPAQTVPAGMLPVPLGIATVTPPPSSMMMMGGFQQQHQQQQQQFQQQRVGYLSS